MLSHEEVKELSDRFQAHRANAEDRLKQEPSDDEMRGVLEDAEEALEMMEDLLTVDDEDLGKYEDQLSDLAERETALADRLER